MRILAAVSVRELTFVGVGFEKTRNLKLVTQNFFVPLHPEIGLRPFNAASQRFNAYGCSSGLRPFKKFNAASQRFKALRAFNAAELRSKPCGRSFSASLRKRQSRAQCCCAAEKSKFRK
ncbi:MAG: hypothetical protein IJQ48_03385 [Prevotella sp.]|nr:hypothetical protein [Prevotella sp.]